MAARAGNCGNTCATFPPVSYAAAAELRDRFRLPPGTSLDDADAPRSEEAGARDDTSGNGRRSQARLAQNFARMRENGVTIDEKPPADVMAALRAAAETVVADWQ